MQFMDSEQTTCYTKMWHISWVQVSLYGLAKEYASVLCCPCLVGISAFPSFRVASQVLITTKCVWRALFLLSLHNYNKLVCRSYIQALSHKESGGMFGYRHSS